MPRKRLLTQGLSFEAWLASEYRPIGGGADAMTQQSSVAWDTTAYDAVVYPPLRAELYFDAVADVQPTAQTHPGAAVTFTKFTDLTAITAAASETADVDAVALSDSAVTLTLAEYINAVNTTAKLRGTSYIELDPVVANALGYNAGISIDGLARTALQAGTNVRYSTGASDNPTTTRQQLEADDKLNASDARYVFAQLVNANVQSFNGLYKAFVHPFAAHDLRAETGADKWRDPHTYSQPGAIWNGSVGEFEGFEWIVTPRAPLFADTGSPATVDVFATIFVGRQALAKAFSITDGNGPLPKIVPSPIVDKARRFVPMAWYWLGAYGRFREECLYRVESGSSIGAN
jgi:N4-gp56 family major capsid protein